MERTSQLLDQYAALTDIVLDNPGPLGVQIIETARTLDGLINGLGVNKRLLEARQLLRAALLCVEPTLKRIDQP